MGSRVLKVCGASPYANAYGQFVEVPSIKLQGRWLEAAGFRVGCKVEVLQNTDEIILKLTKQE